VNVLPAAIEDIVSEGFYEFHTENLLTVNQIHRPFEWDQDSKSVAPRISKGFDKSLLDLAS
jgi:hypothetical protein